MNFLSFVDLHDTCEYEAVRYRRGRSRMLRLDPAVAFPESAKRSYHLLFILRATAGLHLYAGCFGAVATVLSATMTVKFVTYTSGKTSLDV